MHACTTHPARNAALGSTAAPATTLLATIAAWAGRLDGWLALRARAARDREVLAEMSDRELHDIGLARGLVDDAASGAWHRDSAH